MLSFAKHFTLSFAILFTSQVYAEVEWIIDEILKVEKDYYNVYLYSSDKIKSSCIVISNALENRRVPPVVFGGEKTYRSRQNISLCFPSFLKRFSIGKVTITIENYKKFIFQKKDPDYDLKEYEDAELKNFMVQTVVFKNDVLNMRIRREQERRAREKMLSMKSNSPAN